MATAVPFFNIDEKKIMPLLQRCFQAPDQSFFLFGPRGTGKSTLIRQIYTDALWIDLLRPEILRRYLAYPERLSALIDGNPDKKIIVIDEVQKAPSLLAIVHSLIEEKRGLTFILTGSSARKLKRTAADLLAGRALRRVLHPFMACELNEAFSLKRALHEGLLPLAVTGKNPTDILEAYIALYLQEKIQADGLVRNVEDFARFLEMVSFSHGSLLNTTNVARECEVKRKTVENYLQILEDLMLAYTLPVFTKKARRALISHSKFYLFDSGVFYTLRPKGLLDKTEEIEGVALEGLVFQHLKAWNDYSQGKHTLAFWRTRSGVEVDFIVYGPLGFWAIEVKHSDRIYSKDTQSLEVFLVDYPEAKAILLYCGTEIIRQGNVLCLPCEAFLRQLKPDQVF